MTENDPLKLNEPASFKERFNAVMRYGFFLGCYMSLIFILMVVGVRLSFASIISIIMILCYPVVLYQMGIKYRREYMADRMSYLESLTLLGRIFLFGLIILTLVFYIGFRYLLNDPTFLTYLKEIRDMIIKIYQDQPEIRQQAHYILPLDAKELTLNCLNCTFWIGFLFNFLFALPLYLSSKR